MNHATLSTADKLSIALDRMFQREPWMLEAYARGQRFALRTTTEAQDNAAEYATESARERAELDNAARDRADGIC